MGLVIGGTLVWSIENIGLKTARIFVYIIASFIVLFIVPYIYLHHELNKRLTMNDRVEKRGAKPKLSLEQIREIITLDDSMTYLQIADKFGVSKNTIGNIIRCRRGAYKKK